MIPLLLSALLSQSGFFLEHFGAHGLMGKAMGGLADKVITLRITTDDEDSSGDTDVDPDDASDLEVLPPVPPVPPVPPAPPVPPRVKRFPAAGAPRELAHFSEKAKNVPTAEV